MWVCRSWAKDVLVRWWRARNKERGRLNEREVLRVRERKRERDDGDEGRRRMRECEKKKESE